MKPPYVSPPPSPSALDFCLRVASAQGAVQLRLDDALGTLHGLSFGDFRLLLELRDAPAPGLPRAALAARLGLTPANLTRALLPLEKIGLLTRQQGAGANAGCAALTAAARARLPAALETAQMLCARMLDAGPGQPGALAALCRQDAAVTR